MGGSDFYRTLAGRGDSRFAQERHLLLSQREQAEQRPRIQEIPQECVLEKWDRCNVASDEARARFWGEGIEGPNSEVCDNEEERRTGEGGAEQV